MFDLQLKYNLFAKVKLIISNTVFLIECKFILIFLNKNYFKAMFSRILHKAKYFVNVS